jgi:putative transposase
MSIWEHRAALERLRAEGRAQVDEDARLHRRSQ